MQKRLFIVIMLLLSLTTASDAQVREQKLFTTTFTDWRDVGLNNNSPVNVKKLTRYSGETVTFKVYDTQISSSNKNAAKFPLWKGGFLMAAKAPDACIITTPLKSITKVHFRHGATGSFRGWKLEAKGDCDKDWVTVSNATAEPPAGSDVTAKVNRTNCQLRFTNIDPKQNAYLFQIDIYGNVDMTGKAKPVFTVTYHNVDGAAIATQKVKQDSPIGTLNNGRNVTVSKGRKFRGWLLAANGSKKATSKTVVTDDLDLYALVTDIEGDESFERNVYDFANPCFYPEDHEALSFHGSFPKVKVNGNATVIVYRRVPTKTVSMDNHSKDTIIVYNGKQPTILDIPFKKESIGKLIVINTGNKQLKPDKNGFYVAEPGNANSILGIFDLISAHFTCPSRPSLPARSSDSSLPTHPSLPVCSVSRCSATASPIRIYLPNGIYDFGNMTEIPIPCDNLSIIGESMDSTILVTAPEVQKEGLGTADFFLNTHSNLYLQDLTLRNALGYYKAGGAGRAAVINDQGNRTIYNNVRMLSCQDTYYSQNNSMQSYFLNCEIHGTVDFICGGGDVRFDNCNIVLESRKADGSGSRILTAPSTTTKFGYVFDNCKIIDLSMGKGEWNFGRTWRNAPISIFLNTTLDDSAAKTLIKSRWIQKGMNNTNPKCFGEYGTKASDGENITPKSNIITSYDGSHETILNADEASAYSYDKMFTDWNPRKICEENRKSNVTK